MAYYGSNPMPVTQDSLTAVLCGGLGLTPSMPRDGRCVFAWAPYSKLKDRGALLRASQGSMQCSSYYARSGLVHKDKLHAMLQANGSALALPTVQIELPAETSSLPAATASAEDTGVASRYDANSQRELYDQSSNLIADAVESAWNRLEETVAGLESAEISSTAQPVTGSTAAAAPPPLQCAVLKHSRTNNAFDVHIVASAAQACAVLKSALARQASGEAPAPVSGAWCLQQHCPDMLLVDGCKWTVRVNMLCVGRLAVFLHEHVVCHVASQPLQRLQPVHPHASPPPPPAAQHITNHSVQHCLPSYDRSLHTVLLADLLQSTRQGQRTFSCLHSPVQGTPVPKTTSESAAGSVVATSSPAVRDIPQPSLQQAMASLGTALAGTVDSVFRRGKARWFMPTRNNFEVFGVDLLPCVSQSGALAWRVLEVNEGPALEALAMPPLNRDIVRDTVALVTHPWLHRLCAPGGENQSVTAVGASASADQAAGAAEGGGTAAEGGGYELRLAPWLTEQHGCMNPSPASPVERKGVQGGWLLVARTAGSGSEPLTTPASASAEETAVTQLGITDSLAQYMDTVRALLDADGE